jgi:hypothetical protein
MSIYDMASAVRRAFRSNQTDRPTDTIYGTPLEDRRAAMAAMQCLLNRVKDEARVGKDPSMVLSKIYVTADRGNIPTEMIDGMARDLMDEDTADRVMDAYREVAKRKLQAAKTRKLDVGDLLGEAAPVTV